MPLRRAAAASAVVDCKQDGDEYPNKELAGVGVALKLVCACEGDSAAMLERYVDLVAIGTVADVMPLVDENRYLVHRGLARLASSPRPGIAAMLREASVDAKKLTATNYRLLDSPAAQRRRPPRPGNDGGKAAHDAGH